MGENQSRLEISLLGTFNIKLDGVPIHSFESDKTRALLAYLANEPGVFHRREKIAGLLWPDKPEKTSRNNLRQTLFQLRKTIHAEEKADPIILATPQEICLQTGKNTWVDVVEFNQLIAQIRAHHPQFSLLCSKCASSMKSALELYRGDFLTAFSLPKCTQFNWWVLSLQEHYHRVAMEALNELGEFHTTKCEYQTAGQYYQRMIDIEPWLELAHRGKMRSLASSGENGAALQQFQSCQQILKQEFDIAPSQQTLALMKMIRSGSQDIKIRTKSLLPQHRQELSTRKFFARKQEMKTLHAQLDAAIEGQGKILFISGEAGSGKTALASTFAGQTLALHPNLLVTWGGCSPTTGNALPYLPFLSVAKQLIGHETILNSQANLSMEAVRRLKDAVPTVMQCAMTHGMDLTRFLMPEENRKWGYGFIPTFHDKSDMQSNLDLEAGKTIIPEQASILQSVFFNQIAQFLNHLAKEHPLLIIFDDLQWADNSTIDLLYFFEETLSASPILILCNFRPEQVEQNGNRTSHPINGMLNKIKRRRGNVLVDLAQTDGFEFLQAYLDSEPNKLDGEFRKSLYALTEGHPLFTIDLLQCLKEGGGVLRDDEGNWVQSVNIDWHQIPVRVEAVIAERIEGLSEFAQQFLKAASIQGDEFNLQILASVLERDIAEIIEIASNALGKKHQIIFPKTCPPIERLGHLVWQYHFKHSLYQKYIYQSMDLAEQLYLHKRTGDALEAQFDQKLPSLKITEDYYSQLAWHFEKSREYEKAAQYLLQAGSYAYRISGNEEAINLIKKGLNCLQLLPHSESKDQLKLDLLFALLSPTRVKYGFVSPEGGELCERITDLSHQAGSNAQKILGMYIQWSYHTFHVEHQAAYQIAQEIVSLAEESRYLYLLHLAHEAAGFACLFQNNMLAAKTHFSLSVNPEEQMEKGFYPNTLGLDHYVNRLGSLALVNWHLGDFEKAYRYIQKSIERAQKIKHNHSLGYAFSYAALIYLLNNDSGSASYIKKLKVLLDESPTPMFQFWYLFMKGWLHVNLVEYEKAVQVLEQCVDFINVSGFNLYTAQIYSLLSTAENGLGHYSSAMQYVDKALSLIQQQGGELFLPDILMAKGKLLLNMGIEKDGENCFHEVLQSAQERQTKSWQLRASLALVQSWKSHNKLHEAQQLLKEAIQNFPEGTTSSELRRARQIFTPSHHQP